MQESRAHPLYAQVVVTSVHVNNKKKFDINDPPSFKV